MGKVLKDWAQKERDEFDRYYQGGNCSCHISPPCGSCTDHGNPRNQEEDEDCWMWETMSDMLDDMEQEARAAIKKSVELSVKKHVAEIIAAQEAKQVEQS